MTEKLKRCPFCGGEALPGSLMTFGRVNASMCCGDCGAEVGKSSETFDEAHAKAMRAWNRRAVDVDRLLLIADELEAIIPMVLLDSPARKRYAEAIREACGVVA